MRLSGKQKKYVAIGALGLFVAFAFTGVFQSIMGWEVGAGLYSVRIEDKMTSAIGKRMIVYDPDGEPMIVSERMVGYEYAKVWFGIQSDPKRLGITGTFPETGRVERTVDGQVYECVYQVITYEMTARAYSLTMARKYASGVFAYPIWITDAGISSDLAGRTGAYYANQDHFDIELSLWFEIDPWDYRVGDYVWGGVLNAWVSDTDVTPLAWDGYGDFGDGRRDSPAEADPWEVANLEVLEGEGLGGNWKDLAPDPDFASKVKISVGGTMKQGADLKVGILGDVTGIDIADIQMDWDIRVEVLVINGWIPEEGEEEIPEHEHEQEQHMPDIWETLNGLFAWIGGFMNFMIFVVVALLFGVFVLPRAIKAWRGK